MVQLVRHLKDLLLPEISVIVKDYILPSPFFLQRSFIFRLPDHKMCIDSSAYVSFTNEVFPESQFRKAELVFRHDSEVTMKVDLFSTDTLEYNLHKDTPDSDDTVIRFVKWLYTPFVLCSSIFPFFFNTSSSMH